MPTSTLESSADTSLTDALEAFFRRRSDDPASCRLARYERVIGGYSRLMLRVWVQEAGVERGYVVRGDPPPEESVVATDRTDEWALLCALRDRGTIPTPRPLWFEPDGAGLGTPVIVTEMIDGPSLLSVAVRSEPGAHRALADPLCELAARIHSFDTGALPPNVEQPRSWDEYIDGRIREWVDTERELPTREPFIRMLACWLAANKPMPVPLGLVHGDFQPGNVVIDTDGTYRMVDWELAHIGDPREDLGYMALAGVNQPPWLLATDARSFYDAYADLMEIAREAVDPATIAYFTVLGTTGVYLGILRRLAALARGEITSALLAYMADGVAGMENVFMDALAAHADATGASA
jgi:aminoglycoside phosphotransferase (APT) family kinase protein